MANIDIEGILKELPNDGRIPKTKIVCTLGPASRSVPMVEKLLRAGMNVARFNFSHGTHEYHQETLNNLRIAMQNTQILCAVMLDTKGPEIRTGFLKDGKPIQLKEGEEITITTDYSIKGDQEMISMSYKKLPVDLKPGNTILCADGTITLTVLSCDPAAGTVRCRCENTALLGERKNVNLPGVVVDLPTLTEKDKEDILEWGVPNKIDMIALSFVRKGSDLVHVRKVLGSHAKRIQLMSKVENQEGVINFDEILRETDSFMVARGDLGMEIPVKTRGIQHFENDEFTHATALGVLLHGDAAFAGQGVVYETMGFHNLPSYGTGGTIHLIVNNQIGFTTDPRFSRSTPYPSDIAKAIDAPIFHVNGDNVEAVTFVCQLAADWRAKYKKDVVVDIVCYRRYGHNETDQPSFTQPRMYKAIEKQLTPLTQYTNFLTKQKTFTEKDIEEHKQWVWGMLEKAAAGAKTYEPSPKEWLASAWPNFPSPKELSERTLPHHPTGVPEETLKYIGEVISSYPKDFTPHRNLARIIQQRGKTITDGNNIDMSTAEALAFGALVLEKIDVRISGQDVERGTFSQRHAVLHDQNTEAQYVPLKNLGRGQAAFTACNSSLSEFGVLGFELGYSLVSPASLVIWEAQFGDFANNAQCIIDQFIASGERKWFQRTGLVMSMPHGYDGQGPEHSSGRMERFLQLCDDHPHIYPPAEKLERQHQDCNMQIVYPTTPANYFHVLRRQVRRDFRKPLILFFSKSLLRHPQARSDLSEMAEGTSFQRYLPEPHPEFMVAPEEVRRHILCTGQVYFALLKEREARGIKDVAISRVEQISPFPYDQITPHLDKYPNADLMWCQEEPLNCGAWTYVGTRILTAANETAHHKGKYPYYAGRPPYSSVATGNKAQHAREINQFVETAFAHGRPQ